MAEPTPLTTTSKVLSPKSLAHIVLRTSNYKAMVSFYKAFLGAHAAHEDEHIAFLTYDDEHHRVAIVNMPSCRLALASAPALGMDHVAFSFDSLRDLLLSYRQRKGWISTPSISSGSWTAARTRPSWSSEGISAQGALTRCM